MKEVKVDDIRECVKFRDGVIFFLPVKTRPDSNPPFSHPMFKRFWHTGIIFGGYVYETFNHGRYSKSGVMSGRGEELLKQMAVFFEVSSLITRKLEEELTSGTSCEEYVLRVLGLSDRIGSDKGDKFPDDVYEILEELSEGDSCEKQINCCR